LCFNVFLRFNLGIACINLRRYEEAAQNILDALVLQDSDGVRDSDGLNDKRGVTSSTLWDTLKTTCLHMQKIELAALCDRRDLDAFRNAFQTVISAETQ
jgi:peroxin-5